MRPSILAFVLPSFFIPAMPAWADLITPDLTISLAPVTEVFYVTGATPDPGDCLSEYCALFSGTLTDNDTDDSIMSLVSATLSFTTSPATGSLTIDNTFANDVPGILIGDPTFVYPSFPYFQYGGPVTGVSPVFGIDIAPGTSLGIYSGTLSIYTTGGTNDTGSGETFTENFTIDVVPEPSAASLLGVGFSIFAVWQGVRRKWHSSEASR
jgi:hypothetical protein